MSKKNTHILTIAGFDPSGGAGILADIKTFEHFKCQGMAVQTANTIQTASKFHSVNWIDEVIVSKQLEFLLTDYSFKFVKIGLVKNLNQLNTLIDILLKAQPKTTVIWDPVLSTSSGFDFNQNFIDLNKVLKKIDIITPNWNEIKVLSGEKEAMQGAELLSELTKVYLKGGHHPINLGKDFLFINHKTSTFTPKKTVKPITEKHGSGCVFSSALTANLCHGYPLQKSILKSKRYIEQFLSSSKDLLGKHKI